MGFRWVSDSCRWSFGFRLWKEMGHWRELNVKFSLHVLPLQSSVWSWQSLPLAATLPFHTRSLVPSSPRLSLQLLTFNPTTLHIIPCSSCTFCPGRGGKKKKKKGRERCLEIRAVSWCSGCTAEESCLAASCCWRGGGGAPASAAKRCAGRSACHRGCRPGPPAACASPPAAGRALGRGARSAANGDEVWLQNTRTCPALVRPKRSRARPTEGAGWGCARSGCSTALSVGHCRRCPAPRPPPGYSSRTLFPGRLQQRLGAFLCCPRLRLLPARALLLADSRSPPDAAPAPPPPPQRRGGCAAAPAASGRWRCRGSGRRLLAAGGVAGAAEAGICSGWDRVQLHGTAGAPFSAGKALRMLIATQAKLEMFLLWLCSAELCKKTRTRAALAIGWSWPVLSWKSGGFFNTHTERWLVFYKPEVNHPFSFLKGESKGGENKKPLHKFEEVKIQSKQCGNKDSIKENPTPSPSWLLVSFGYFCLSKLVWTGDMRWWFKGSRNQHIAPGTHINCSGFCMRMSLWKNPCQTRLGFDSAGEA